MNQMNLKFCLQLHELLAKRGLRDVTPRGCTVKMKFLGQSKEAYKTTTLHISD